MGLMEVELALAEHRQRTREMERWHGFRRAARERAQLGPARVQEGTGQEGIMRPKIDWPVFTLRLGPLRLALFRTVRLPAGTGRDSHGTPRVLPG
ncbi:MULTISPECIES: hypothetical protein [unclassified Arthrobacter]|uniref:hypothetical protein n=1 Tax=unclassified Arthrobacter TaxID=235627 RepID=UPI001D148457|nr:MULTISPECIES: hypothetical protein [unclassified Arthrobacter]MCC3276599.1 hypothetical protein [Arthrobacter sp. zg-Y20]MCC9178381.1 hypothetical protein [Arthrobacter sp. zg-Y750]MDK1316759.1 hypothetical protein [Arthrobacter sp. zg.Y20]WIB06823.1 hypothetical protein QNO06_03565 [Arthrobacter sp. zg-Y20]